MNQRRPILPRESLNDHFYIVITGKHYNEEWYGWFKNGTGGSIPIKTPLLHFMIYSRKANVVIEKTIYLIRNGKLHMEGNTGEFPTRSINGSSNDSGT